MILISILAKRNISESKKKYKLESLSTILSKLDRKKRKKNMSSVVSFIGYSTYLIFPDFLCYVFFTIPDPPSFGRHHPERGHFIIIAASRK